MSKVTLKRVADELYGPGEGLPSNALCERGAALVRAAAAVVETAFTFVVNEPDRLSYEDDLRELGKALRRYREVEKANE